MQKFTIYGLPLTPRPLLAELKGASFCVSYATRGDLGAQLDQAIELVGADGILLVDNGAYTLHKKGVSTRSDEYLEGFADWANDILARCPQAIAVLPDVIGGTEQENCDLVLESMTMIDPDRAMPVWHLHESLGYLTYLCESFGYVAFGSSGEFWQVGPPKWRARIAEAFAAIKAWEKETGEIRPRIHMMRAQCFAHMFPFDSSDSSNLAVNHVRYKGRPGHVARLAKRIDGKIQATAWLDAGQHQEMRPLLDHIETSNLRTVWLLEAAGYRIEGRP